MRRLALFLGVALLWPQLASAQDWAKPRLNNSPRHREWVEIQSGGRTLKAFVVYPERKEKAPVVLVIQRFLD